MRESLLRAKRPGLDLLLLVVGGFLLLFFPAAAGFAGLDFDETGVT